MDVEKTLKYFNLSILKKLDVYFSIKASINKMEPNWDLTTYHESLIRRLADMRHVVNLDNVL